MPVGTVGRSVRADADADSRADRAGDKRQGA